MQKLSSIIKHYIWGPIALIAIILCGLMAAGAIMLWIQELSYTHPGPARAVAMLALVFLIIGLVIQRLQVQRNPHRRPRIIGLELLVERWQQFERQQADSEADSEILYEMFAIAQSIAQLKYSDLYKFRFLKYFSGFNIKSGAFLVQADNHIPLVLKFDSVTNIKTEIERYKSCVAGRLNLMPGEPEILPQQYGKIEGKDWGAITYNLLDAAQTGHGRLQTFAEYYRSHDTSEEITQTLTKVFEVFRPWWENSVGPSDECGRWKRDSLYKEYDRLTRKERSLQQGIANLGQTLEIQVLQNITFNQKQIKLDHNLTLRNPINWIDEVFSMQNLPNWIKETKFRKDSIVHGDLHTGNILISADDHRQIKA